MTTLHDVIRQVETALGDPSYPPTLKEKEILTTILYQVSAGAADTTGSR